jgi:hypothetical protein
VALSDIGGKYLFRVHLYITNIMAEIFFFSSASTLSLFCEIAGITTSHIHTRRAPLLQSCEIAIGDATRICERKFGIAPDVNIHGGEV